MKKFSTTITAIGLAFLLAAPALALDAGNLSFSGEYRARGFSHSAINLDEDDATSAYYDMRLRVKTVYKVTDNISLTTRFDALDKVWGDDDEDGSDIENIDFDAAYLTIKTPVGGFLVGRYPTTKFGTGLADSSDNKDRIIYVLPIENWTFAATMQKSNEFDKGTEVSDADNHKYGIVAQYKGKNFTTGAVLGIYDYKTLPAPLQLDEFMHLYGAYNDAVDAANLASATLGGTINAALDGGIPQTAIDHDLATPGATLSAYGIPDLNALANDADAKTGQATYAGSLISSGSPATYEVFAYVPEAFFIGKFGSFGIEAEIDYATGKAENATDGKEDLDASLLMYLAEVSYDAGPFAFRGGYVSISGDEDPYDDDLTCFAYVERSADLDKTFILTGNDGDARVGAGLDGYSSSGSSLGGYGTVAAGEVTDFRYPAVRAGIKMFYAGVTYSPTENLSLDFVYANAKADEPADTILVPNSQLGLPGAGSTVMDRDVLFGMGMTQYDKIDDDMGNEYDFTLTWKFLDNLEYKFVAAYLDAGDFWQQGDDSDDIEDLYTFYNSLTLTF